MPYPDDCDDTFCALSALYEYDRKLIDGSVIAKAVAILTATEEREGGPYFTWLAPPKDRPKWKDIDLAVNSNIAYFLSLLDVSLESIDSLVQRTIRSSKYFSPYYYSPHSVVYFISRYYRKIDKKKVIQYLLLIRDLTTCTWGNPLDTALAVSALLNFGAPTKDVSKSVSWLCRLDMKEVQKPYPLVVERISKKNTYYAGSPALTVAFYLEALNKYALCFDDAEKKNGNKGTAFSSDRDARVEYIFWQVKSAFFKSNAEMKNDAGYIFHKVISEDNARHISLLPYYFKKALGKTSEDISSKTIVGLGLANLYGWTAYTVYDNFFDDEGEINLLPLANKCLREVAVIFSTTTSLKTGFLTFFRDVMDKIDLAYRWELAECRMNPAEQIKPENTKAVSFKIPAILPDYGSYQKLAERSLGYALGPAAILFLLEYRKGSQEIISLMDFFKHYLIAKQLNDDAHDWEEDLKRGHISSAVALLLHEWKKGNTQAKRVKMVDPVQDLPRLQKLFWYKVIPIISRIILKEVELAGKAATKVSTVENFAFFDNRLEPISKAARETLVKQKQVVEFLGTYNTGKFPEPRN